MSLQARLLRAASALARSSRSMAGQDLRPGPVVRARARARAARSPAGSDGSSARSSAAGEVVEAVPRLAAPPARLAAGASEPRAGEQPARRGRGALAPDARAEAQELLDLALVAVAGLRPGGSGPGAAARRRSSTVSRVVRGEAVARRLEAAVVEAAAVAQQAAGARAAGGRPARLQPPRRPGRCPTAAGPARPACRAGRRPRPAPARRRRRS